MKPAIALLALLIGLCAPACRAADILNMGFYLPGIRDANLADVHITLQLWADEVGKAHGIAATAYTYTVTLRDKSAAANTTASSSPSSWRSTIS